MSAVLKFLYDLLIPALVLMATYFALPFVPTLGGALQPLIHYAPYGLILFGMVLAVRFNRGRVFYLLVGLGLALAGHDYLLTLSPKGFATQVLVQALYLLLPLTAVLLFYSRERGILSLQGRGWLGFILVQPLAVGWVIKTQQSGLLERLTQPLFPAPYLAILALPQPALMIMAAGLALILVRMMFMRRSPIDSGFLGAYLAILLASFHLHQGEAFSLYSAAGVLILIISVIQDSHRMAYRDELTGLLGRRALNEYMMGLGGCYTIAMLDVDHFKKFNDSYGHDVGDQVLKMVGSKMKEISGGGKPFRYGGEEFSIIFPRRQAEQAIPHLEALRGTIAAYRLQLRGKGRPSKARDGKKLRSSKRGDDTVSVTISIGVAERSGEHKTAASVIKQADTALYRAKNKGRNCLSR